MTDKVDAFPGMADDGWATEWRQRETGTHTVMTDDTDPLHTGPGGDLKYLDCTVTSISTARKYGSVARPYTAGINILKPHVLDWLYRVDEGVENPENPPLLTESAAFEDFNDRYQMWDDPAPEGLAIGDTVSPNSSWSISVYGGIHDALPIEKVGHWIVFDGGGHEATPDTGFVNARNIDTEIAVRTGVIYDFHVEIDPDNFTWDVTITCSDGSSFDSKTQGENPDHPGVLGFENGLGWRTSAATVGGAPHFNGCTDYDGTNVDTREYSFDAVSIVPEPSALLLLVSAGLALAACARRGR